MADPLSPRAPGKDLTRPDLDLSQKVSHGLAEVLERTALFFDPCSLYLMKRHSACPSSRESAVVLGM